MALTLVEAAKLNSGDVIRSTVIEQFARSSGILLNLPFEDIQGNALRYNREEKLPGIGFRGVNEGYLESTGILNPITEPLVIAGGDLDVDKFITDTMGDVQRGTQEMMKVKALSLAWEATFLKGDSSSEPREFDGLQRRITGGQLVAAGTTSGGDALSLSKLDELIDQVSSPTHLLMSKAMRRRLTQAARSTTIGGFIQWEKDAFGRQVALYGDLPIITVENDNNDMPILGFDEAAPGGGATATSIYCVSFTDGMLTGIQSGAIDVRDLGELEEKPAFRTRVEWYSGIAIFNGKGAARLWGIKDAPVVA